MNTIDMFIDQLNLYSVNFQFVMEFFVTVVLITFILLSLCYYIFLEKINIILYMIGYCLALTLNQFSLASLYLSTSITSDLFWLQMIEFSKLLSVLLLFIAGITIGGIRVHYLSLIDLLLFLVSLLFTVVTPYGQIVVSVFTLVNIAFLIMIVYMNKDLLNRGLLIKCIILYTSYFVIDQIFLNTYGLGVSLDWLIICGVILLLVIYFLNRYKQILDEKTALYEKLIKDELTGIYSKAYFNDFFEERYLGYLVMIDINKFKGVNDDYNHNLGDMLLGRLGSILKTYESKGLISARVGGDEFMIYSRKVDESFIISQCELVIEEFGEAIKSLKLAEVVGLGLSIGVAKVNGASKAILFENVDKAMYEAKKLGNNMIIQHK